MLVERPELTENDVRGKLVAYSSDQSNSAIEKAFVIAAVSMKLLKTNESGVMTGDVLQQAVDEDLANGKIPFICIATLGTTGTCAFDDLESLGPVCNGNNIWLHLDAAYAGSALCCPEFRPRMTGIEYADSFNYNLYKWMMVNFDGCPMWPKNADDVIDAFVVDRVYLDHKQQGNPNVPDFRHWQIQLGRRFRSLKVWIVLRTLGLEKIRDTIRHQVKLAEHFANYVRSDDRFEIVSKPSMGLVCFRLKGECKLSRDLLERITERKQIYMVPEKFNGRFIIRFVVGGRNPQEHDMSFAWQEIQSQADELLKSLRPPTSETILEKTAISFSKVLNISHHDVKKSII